MRTHGSCEEMEDGIMRLENMKYDFPKMPEEMRTMIEKEVNKQVTIEQPQFRKNRRAAGRTVAASLAAVMLCGTTVFAGVNIYRMQQEKIGEHGVSVNIAGNETAGAETGDVVQTQQSVAIPNVRLEVGYVPEGMVRTEQGKYSFENALNQGGVSMAFFKMDTGDDQFEVKHGNVVSSEEFTVNGRQGVYLEYPDLYEEEITFNQRIYVAFTDVHYVMELYAASDVSKEEALKIAENVKLVPTDNMEDEALVVAQNWSDYQKGMEESQQQEGLEIRTSIAKEEMKNIHGVGDSFVLKDQNLTAKVSDVKVTDDISLLDASYQDEDLQNEADENGKLRPATVQYVKDGDMNSLSQEISSRQVPQKLVYTTVEYTNTGSETLTDVLFFASMMRIKEADGKMQIQNEYETPAQGDEWERAVNHGLSNFWEMSYYDVHGGERGNNYIPSIEPGETVTVHMAWVVTEEELDSLFLNLDSNASSYEFSDSALEVGYVDIRQ